jgi:hypothetical protein
MPWLSSTPGNAKPIFRTVSKLIVLLGMGECDYLQEHNSPNSYCCLAYSALACLRMGMSGSLQGEEVLVAVLYCLDSCRRTTSESEWPRSMPSFFPSGDQWNESICSDVKFVIRWPAEPSRGCTRTLSTPFSRMI